MASEILEEEQIAMLGKMLRSLNEELTPREMQVFDLLVESLNERASRMRRIRRFTSRAHVMPAADGIERDQKAEADVRLLGKARLLKKKPPQEVVRTFVECYNTRDFETEYLCLARDFGRGKPKPANIEEYVEQRTERMKDREAYSFASKRVSEISSAEIVGITATVDCVETHEGARETTILFRNYTLVNEDGAWRIQGFSTRRRTTTPSSSKA